MLKLFSLDLSFMLAHRRKILKLDCPGYNLSFKRGKRSILPMSASANTVHNDAVNGDWTTVLRRRRGKQTKVYPKIQTAQEQQQQWVSSDLKVDTEIETKLARKIEISMKKVENSCFFQTLIDQVESPEMMDRFSKVLGCEENMKMVVYGIGSIEAYESPRSQLSVALLLKKKFKWIGDIEVFDPILSATESSILKTLGCSVLSVNEQGCRPSTKPILFYMPHCEVHLYENLLQANWQLDKLNNIALFGNSANAYHQHASQYKNSILIHHQESRIFAAREFTQEFAVEVVSDDYFHAFSNSSWHFFSAVSETQLQGNSLV